MIKVNINYSTLGNEILNAINNNSNIEVIIFNSAKEFKYIIYAFKNSIYSQEAAINKALHVLNEIKSIEYLINDSKIEKYSKLKLTIEKFISKY